MGWGNPVVAGVELIRTAIQSPNFSLSPPVGWQININGQAFFASLSVPSVLMVSEELEFPFTAWLAPSGDTTGVLDTLRINTLLSDHFRVIFTGGIYWINATLLPLSQGLLAGIGGSATVLNAVAGFTGSSMIALPATTTDQVTVRDLQLNCEGLIAGVYWNNTGFTGTPDTNHLLENVWVFNALGDAFASTTGSRENRTINCHVVGATGYGFNCGCTDSKFIACTTENTELDGFNIPSANNAFEACKAFYAGWNGSSFDTTHSGFNLNGAQYTTVTGCSAQQNALHGFNLNGCFQCTLTGCESDTNNAGNATPAGVGINLVSNIGCTITGNSGDNNTGLSTYPPGQKWGIQVAGTQTATEIIGNSCNGSSGRFGFVSGGGYLLINTDITDLSSATLQKVGALSPAYDGSVNTLANGSTIPWGTAQGSYFASSAAAAAITGLILQAPTGTGANDPHLVTIVNTNPALSGSMTFAAAGTSNVSGGTAIIIDAGTGGTFLWSPDEALWYPLKF